MKRTLAAAIALGLGCIGSAPGQAQTLEEALVAAYLTNPDLEAQRAAPGVERLATDGRTRWHHKRPRRGQLGR